MGWVSGLPETPCGHGSTVSETVALRVWLNGWRSLRVNDAGCGDMNWSRLLKWKDYVGYDRQEWESPYPHPFVLLDITRENMRPCDIIICRDVFIHFDNDTIMRTLDLFRQSSEVLMSTSFPGASNKRAGLDGKCWQPLDLSSKPFDLEPLGNGCGRERLFSL